MKLKKTIFILARALVGAGLLCWLFFKTDIKAVLACFNSIPVWAWTSAVISTFLCQLTSVIRWNILGATSGFKVSFSSYFRYYFIGNFFSLFLPSSIGGDVFKIFMLSKGESRRMDALMTVLADRGFGICLLVLIACFAGFFEGWLVNDRLKILILGAAPVAMAGLVMPPFLEKFFQKLPWPDLQKFLFNAVIFWKNKQTLAVVIFLSFMVQFFGIIPVIFLDRGMEIGQSGMFYFYVIPLVVLFVLLPVTFNGLGLREGALVYFLGLKGVPAEKAISLGLAMLVSQMLVALLGGIFYVFHGQEPAKN